jgi:ribosomal protein L12E/L44/L45/RPP1/RPP2
MSKTKTENLDRRSFLKGIGTGAAGAATVAAGVAAATPAAAAESDADKKKARYKESEHIKKYYATNRYL